MPAFSASAVTTIHESPAVETVIGTFTTATLCFRPFPSDTGLTVTGTEYCGTGAVWFPSAVGAAVVFGVFT